MAKRRGEVKPEQPLPPISSAVPTRAVGKRQTAFQKTAQGFALHVDGRTYELKALCRQATQLRATIKATRAKEDRPFELATIDLYSHRSRQWFAGLCAKRFSFDEAAVLGDLDAILEEVEQRGGEHAVAEDAPRVVEVTDTERAEAIELLKAPNLIEQVTDALGTLGYVGEAINKQLAYLVATSRKLERPLSLLVESRSGAGKSALQDAVLSLMPEEDCLKYSRITDQALFYKAKDGLDGKLLAIEEAAGMGGAAYSIRALQSSEALRVAATGKDPVTGKMKTEEYEVKAKTAVMMTTTQPDFDEETKSRFISATIDETAEMTRHILESQRYDDTLEGIARRRRAERLQRLHQNAQRLLQPVTVANPYAPQLTFPTHSLPARRDNRKYLGLIKAVALVHQYQREVKHAVIDGEEISYIEATLGDIAVANRIARKVLVKHQDITPQAQKLFALIRKMLCNGGGHAGHGTAAFTRRRLREHCGWSDWQVRTHLGELVELEYLRVQQGRSGKEYLYELEDTHLLEALPGFAVTEPEQLKLELAERQVDGDLEAIWPNLEVNQPNLEVISAHLEGKRQNLETQNQGLVVPRGTSRA